jgi:hypothetical protein
MSVVPCITFAGTTQLYNSSGGGGGSLDWSNNPAISNVNIDGFNISNINELDSVEILTGTITAMHAIASNIDVSNITALDAFCGNLTVQNLTDLSGNIKILNEDDQAINYMQAISGNLYFNNQLLAQANNIQDIADWSLYPALQTINADNNGINNTGNISFGNNTNILSVNGGNQLLYNGNIISSLAGVNALNTLTGNLTLSSTNPATLTVANDIANNIINLTVPTTISGVSSINTLTGNLTLLSTNPATLTVDTYSGNNTVTFTVPPSAVPAPVDWANYPAINAVSIPDKNLNMTTSTPGIAYNKATLNADVDIGTLTNAPLRPDFNAYCGTVTFGGLTTPLTAMNINSIGPVSVNSILGISIAGGGGVSVTGGGAVTVNSVGGVLVDGGGAISINGAGGVSIIGTGLLSIASGGVLVSGGGIAINAGGMTISAGGLGVLGGTLAVGTLSGAGGGVNIFGSDIQMIPVGTATASIKTNLIAGYTVGGLAITDVATINGLPYPPAGGSVYQGTYYKSVAQVLSSGNNLITFDSTATGNNSGGYITHTNGTTTFTVTIAGLYQLELNCDVNDTNAVYTVGSNKTISVFLTRATVLKPIIQNSALQATAQVFQMSLSSSYFLNVGDIIQLNLFNSFTGVAPSLNPVDTFSLNTFFSWRFIS